MAAIDKNANKDYLTVELCLPKSYMVKSVVIDGKSLLLHEGIKRSRGSCRRVIDFDFRSGGFFPSIRDEIEVRKERCN